MWEKMKERWSETVGSVSALNALTSNGLAIFFFSYFFFFVKFCIVAIHRVHLVKNAWEELDLEITFKTIWKFWNVEEQFSAF